MDTLMKLLFLRDAHIEAPHPEQTLSCIGQMSDGMANRPSSTV